VDGAAHVTRSSTRTMHDADGGSQQAADVGFEFAN
jgi:hypothetical protein